MKKLNVIVIMLAVFIAASVSQAAMVKQVVLSSTSGVEASYDPTTGVSSWENGASGWIMTDSYDVVNFTSASITGTFSGMTDTSSGGTASALFDTGTWTISLSAGDLQLDISGHIVGNYVETEGKFQEGHIDGRAVVIVDSATFNFGDYFGEGITVDWQGGTGSMAGLIADIALPNGAVFGDYDTDDYLSTNTTITLWADEGVVPEPASLCLLGLGAVSLLKRRRA